MDETQKIQQEINNLICDLNSPVSDIGDWKIAKYMEYQLMGMDTPYDITELNNKRQEARDRINELQEQLANMPKEVEESIE